MLVHLCAYVMLLKHTQLSTALLHSFYTQQLQLLMACIVQGLSFRALLNEFRIQGIVEICCDRLNSKNVYNTLNGLRAFYKFLKHHMYGFANAAQCFPTH